MTKLICNITKTRKIFGFILSLLTSIIFAILGWVAFYYLIVEITDFWSLISVLVFIFAGTFTAFLFFLPAFSLSNKRNCLIALFILLILCSGLHLFCGIVLVFSKGFFSKQFGKLWKSERFRGIYLYYESKEKCCGYDSQNLTLCYLSSKEGTKEATKETTIQTTESSGEDTSPETNTGTNQLIQTCKIVFDTFAEKWAPIGSLFVVIGIMDLITVVIIIIDVFKPLKLIILDDGVTNIPSNEEIEIQNQQQEPKSQEILSHHPEQYSYYSDSLTDNFNDNF